MSTHPYIPLYVDDYDAATTHLTIEEDGVYSRLIRLCWRTPGCSLPNDPAWIARKIRLSEADYERIAKPVIEEFFTLSRGRLIQRRLKREYDDISRKKSARKLAGKKGGEAKALKTKENAPSNATDLPPHTRAFPEPEPKPEERYSEDKSSGAQGAEPDLDKAAWDAAVLVLTSQGGISEKAARGLFGRLLSSNSLRAKDMLPSISGAQVCGTKDPQAYLTRAAKGVAERSVKGRQPQLVGFV